MFSGMERCWIVVVVVVVGIIEMVDEMEQEI